MKVPTEFLSPEDFEAFVNEILKIKLNKNIISFAPGPDGGIDGIDDTINPTVVVQSKRFMSRTQPSKIVQEIKNEIKKISDTINSYEWDKKNIDYIIVTSTSLTPNTRNKIRSLDSDFFNSEEFIIDSTDLASMSKNPGYKKIFEDYNLINKNLIDQVKASNLKCHLEETSDYFINFNIDSFVETNNFKRSYELVSMNNICILTGNPGVGKTTLCKALAYTFCNRKDINISVLERNISEIQEIIDIINRDFDDEKNSLLVVFDDFLGRNYLESQEKDIKRLNKLLGMLKKKNNVYFILNSRTEIINKAQSNLNFYDFMYTNKENNITVNVNDYTQIEKSLIIRKLIEEKYIYASNAKKEIIKSRYSDLLLNQSYKNIVLHKNYNPRLISLVVQRMPDLNENFYEYFIDKLNDPSEIYDELFEKLSVEAKYLLFILYSFESYPVTLEKVISAYNYLNIDSTADIYIILKELKESWIKSEISDLSSTQYIYVQFVNPSIYDYLNLKIKKIEAMKIKIKRNILYLSQTIKIGGIDYLYKNISEKFNFYSDNNNYFGEKIYTELILDKQGYDCLESDLMNFNKGWLYDYKGYKIDGISLAIEIMNSSLEEKFLELILYSKNNEIILNNLVEYYSSDVDDFIKELNNSLLKFYGSNLSQNDLIDDSEKETNFNLFEYLMNIKLNNEQFKIDDLEDTELIDDEIGNITTEDYMESYSLEHWIEDIADKYINKTIEDLKDAGYSEYIDYFDDLDYTPIENYIDEGINNLLDNDSELNFQSNRTNDLTIEKVFEKPLSE